MARLRPYLLSALLLLLAGSVATRSSAADSHDILTALSLTPGSQITLTGVLVDKVEPLYIVVREPWSDTQHLIVLTSAEPTLQRWQTVDVSGLLVTLPTGKRAVQANSIQCYTDSRGKIAPFPLPIGGLPAGVGAWSAGKVAAETRAQPTARAGMTTMAEQGDPQPPGADPPPEPERPVTGPKSLPDGAPVKLTDRVVTASFGDNFYFQEVARSYGLRVWMPSGGAAPAPGTRVTIEGAMRTVGAEREIAAGAVTASEGGLPLPQPVRMQGRSVGGGPFGGHTAGIGGNAAGLNTAGLVVALTGKVTVQTLEGTYFLDDGSGVADAAGRQGVAVEDYDTFPAAGATVTAVGIAGGVIDPADPGRTIRVLRIPWGGYSPQSYGEGTGSIGFTISASGADGRIATVAAGSRLATATVANGQVTGTISGVPYGAYAVSVSLPGYTTATRKLTVDATTPNPSTSVTLSATAPHILLSEAPDPQAGTWTVTARLYEDEGNPLAGVSVVLQTNTGSFQSGTLVQSTSVTTDSYGYATATLYTVGASSPAGATVSGAAGSANGSVNLNDDTACPPPNMSATILSPTGTTGGDVLLKFTVSYPPSGELRGELGPVTIEEVTADHQTTPQVLPLSSEIGWLIHEECTSGDCDNSGNGAQTITYWMHWPSMQSHNGKYRLTIKTNWYAPTSVPEVLMPKEAVLATQEFEVENLHVVYDEPATPKVLKLKEEETGSVTITITVDDAVSDVPVSAVAYIWPAHHGRPWYANCSECQPIKSLELRNQSVGELTFNWDRTDSFGAPVEPGLYVYDVQVAQFQEARWQWNGTQVVQVPGLALPTGQPVGGEDADKRCDLDYQISDNSADLASVDTSTDAQTFLVTYRSGGSKIARPLRLTVYDPFLTQQASAGPLAASPGGFHDVEVTLGPEQMPEAGPYRFLLYGLAGLGSWGDPASWPKNHGDTDSAQRRKPLLEVNSLNDHLPIVLFTVGAFNVAWCKSEWLRNIDKETAFVATPVDQVNAPVQWVQDLLATQIRTAINGNVFDPTTASLTPTVHMIGECGLGVVRTGPQAWKYDYSSRVQRYCFGMTTHGKVFGVRKMEKRTTLLKGRPAVRYYVHRSGIEEVYPYGLSGVGLLIDGYALQAAGRSHWNEGGLNANDPGTARTALAWSHHSGAEAGHVFLVSGHGTWDETAHFILETMPAFIKASTARAHASGKALPGRDIRISTAIMMDGGGSAQQGYGYWQKGHSKPTSSSMVVQPGDGRRITSYVRAQGTKR